MRGFYTGQRVLRAVNQGVLKLVRYETDVVAQATSEIGIDTLPEACLWATAEILGEGWLPSSI